MRPIFAKTFCLKIVKILKNRRNFSAMKLHLLLQKRMETYKKSRKWDLNNFLDEIGENIVYNIDEVVLLTLAIIPVSNGQKATSSVTHHVSICPKFTMENTYSIIQHYNDRDNVSRCITTHWRWSSSYLGQFQCILVTSWRMNNE